ncbi:cobalt-zinc-cadmium efflux system outer membrane protein [Ereboglobus sp. PH5-5]|uniref:TolC family protein n=1 Tax=Ereboglobus sp. PH5-5 TaxID=2940529 RepID=UPI002404EF43|nr:TolC family protein [Ereboglobus sp. PH5-5]MDF9832053.1 cobalt-zinc-cadmium efflux system outer membrane protein [Ereboglobus sp. PH5-5]
MKHIPHIALALLFTLHSSPFTLLRGAPAAEATTIPALITEISAKNPERAFYEAEISAARSSARAATRLADPELSVELGRTRVRASDGSLAGEGAAWSVSLTQTFDWPGRLPLRKAIASRDITLAELGLARFDQALTARARVLATGLHSAATRADAIREVADRFTALKETFLARDPAGLTPLLDTRVIEASELTLQRRATEADLALHAALIELNQLRGAAPDAPLRIDAPHDYAAALAAPPARNALLAAARENNFEYRMRRVELEQQGYAVRLARNERYPGIAVSPYYSQEKADGTERSFGIGLSIPLPVTGRSGAAVNEAESRRRQAEAAACLAERELDRDVLLAAQTLQTKLAETARWKPDTITKFREAAALADRHYRLGAVPISTYIELQNSYLDAVESLLDTRNEALEAALRLEELTGLKLVPLGGANSK